MNSPVLPPLAIDDVSDKANLRLQIGEHIVDFGALRIVTRPDAARLTGKSAAVLLELARRAGNTLTRDELLERVWNGRCPTPDVLTQAIKELRRALAGDAKTLQYIETIPKLGYRLVAPVRVVEEVEAPLLADARVVAVDAVSAQAAMDGIARPPASPKAGVARRIGVAAAIVLATLVLSALVRNALSSASEPEQEPHWRATDIRVVTSDPGAERRPRISPSGTRIAYERDDRSGGFTHILLRSIEPSDVTPLTPTVQAHEAMPAWSPNGKQIAFKRATSARCTMFIASSSGGDEREVGACGSATYEYFDWAPDGESLLTTVRASGEKDGFALSRWDLRSGIKEPLQYERLANGQSLEPRYSPDGNWIAFRRGIAPHSDLCVMSASGGKVRQLTHLASRLRGYTWSPDGRALIFSSNHEGQFGLYAVDIDDGRITSLGISPAEFPDAARATSTVVYEIPLTSNKLVEVAIGSEASEPVPLVPSTGSDRAPALSPDGEHMVFVSDRSGSQQLWLQDSAKSVAMPLTDYQNAVLHAPDWRADGKAVMVTVRHGGSASLVEIDMASRRERLLTAAGESVLSGRYGPTPQSYLVTLGASSRLDQLVLVESGSAGDTRRVIASGIEHAEFDPLSRHVYYTKAAERGLFRRDLVGGAEQAISPLVSSIHMDGWRVVNGRIWYLRGVGVDPVELREFDPARASERLLVRLDVELKDRGFSVTPSRDRVVIAAVASEDADVGAFQLQAGHSPR